MTAANLRYHPGHAWVRPENDLVLVGLSRIATRLNHVVYVDLPDPGSRIRQGEPCGYVEGALGHPGCCGGGDLLPYLTVFAPLSGEVVATNPAIAEIPYILKDDPLAKGWLFVLQPTRPHEWALLLLPEAYQISDHQQR